MIRVTIELLPGGREAGGRTIGVIEIANLRTHDDNTADYAVALKKSPPFPGALRDAWRRGKVSHDDKRLNAVVAGDDEDGITALVTGHHRSRRGVYDLLYRALLACGLDKRNPTR